MSRLTEQTMPQPGTTTINNGVCDTHSAAMRIGLKAQTLRKMRITGEGPQFAKLGRAVRYRVADLDAWLEARLKHSTSEFAKAA